MFILQWKCLTCSHLMSPIPVPFGYHPPIAQTELYCTVCRDLTAHVADVTVTEPIPIRTMADVLAEATQEESPAPAPRRADRENVVALSPGFR